MSLLFSACLSASLLKGDLGYPHRGFPQPVEDAILKGQREMEMEIETASIDKNQTVYIFTLIYIPWLVTETHCVLPIPIYGLLIHLPLTELLVLLPLTDSLIFFHILGTPRRTVRAGLVLPPANFIAHLAGLGGRWGRDISPEEGMSSLMYPQVSCGPPTLLITILLLKSLFILTPFPTFLPSFRCSRTS